MRLRGSQTRVKFARARVKASPQSGSAGEPCAAARMPKPAPAAFLESAKGHPSIERGFGPALSNGRDRPRSHAREKCRRSPKPRRPLLTRPSNSSLRHVPRAGYAGIKSRVGPKSKDRCPTTNRIQGRSRFHAGRPGLGAVPTLRKWNERPGQLVIVRDGFFFCCCGARQAVDGAFQVDAFGRD
jgi:hypothetical protein